MSPSLSDLVTSQGDDAGERTGLLDDSLVIEGEEAEQKVPGGW